MMMKVSIVNVVAAPDATDISSVESYERLYGKFVPDAQNAQWFARQAPRVAELRLARENAAGWSTLSHQGRWNLTTSVYSGGRLLRRPSNGVVFIGWYVTFSAVGFLVDANGVFLIARAFEEDFGHPFSAPDGLNEHFARMESHRSTAEELATLYDNDAEKIAAVTSQPLTFHVYNPYAENDQRRADLDVKRTSLVLSSRY